MSWYKKAQQNNFRGFKMVAWDGQRAYSLFQQPLPQEEGIVPNQMAETFACLRQEFGWLKGSLLTQDLPVLTFSFSKLHRPVETVSRLWRVPLGLSLDTSNLCSFTTIRKSLVEIFDCQPLTTSLVNVGYIDKSWRTFEIFTERKEKAAFLRPHKEGGFLPHTL